MQIHEKERQLHREVTASVESRLPDVDVLAVELGGPDKLTVYIDHPRGVDHALCELGGRKRFRGEVLGASERELVLATGGERVEIPYEAIARGNLIDEG